MPPFPATQIATKDRVYGREEGPIEVCDNRTVDGAQVNRTEEEVYLREQRWLVVRTKPRQERVAVSHLEHRNVDAYCPMYLEPKWNRKTAGIAVPLFTGYIFVECDPEHQLNAVSYCPGVAHPVRFDRQLATVGQDVIDAIKMREGVRGHVMPPEVEIGIRLGNKVMIMAGPLAGMEGIFRGYLRGGERASVLMEFLRQRNLIEVDTEDLADVRA